MSGASIGFRRIATLSGCLLLSACAVEPDPHHGGVLSALVGTVGGGYKQQVATEQALTAAERSRMEEVDRQRMALEALKAERQKQVEALKVELAATVKSLDAINTRIAQAEQRQASNNARLKELRQQSAALRARTQVTIAEAGKSEVSVEALRAEMMSIEVDLCSVSNALDAAAPTPGQAKPATKACSGDNKKIS